MDILREKLKGIPEDFQKIPEAAQGAAAGVNAAMSATIQGLAAVETQAKRTAAAIAAIGAVGGDGAALAHYGKAIYRQHGG